MIASKELLKTWFQRLKQPTESQFHSLIDSSVNKADDTLDDINEGVNVKRFTADDSAKLNIVPPNTIKGRLSAGSGPVEDLSIAQMKTVIDLGNVDNTSDLNKPISNATQSSLDLKQDILISGTNIKTINTNSLLGLGDLTIDKALIGLSAVDNTSDLDKPVSTLTQTALDLKVNTSTTVNNKALSTNITLDKVDIGLANVDNTSDSAKPISVATQAALDLKQNTLISSTNIKSINSNSIVGAGNLVIDKVFVGLTNVDNTSDLDKPISTAVQTALDLKEPANANIQNHIISTSNPHSVTKTDVGLANVDNTADLDKPISTATQTAINAINSYLINSTNILSSSILNSFSTPIDLIGAQGIETNILVKNVRIQTTSGATNYNNTYLEVKYSSGDVICAITLNDLPTLGKHKFINIGSYNLSTNTKIIVQAINANPTTGDKAINVVLEYEVI